MSLHTDYNLYGFQNIKFNVNSLDSSIQKLIDNKSIWREKYQNTYDVIHDFEIDQKFIECLIENNVHRILHEVTQTDLTLIHCQIRHATSTQSYMPWHRDSYVDNKQNWIGNMPPVHKLIIYPTGKITELGNSFSENRLAIIPKSHRMTTDDINLDMQIITQLQWPQCIISSSDDSALLFNTALLHSVQPEQQNSSGSIRIIYSFATPTQFIKKYNLPIHIKFNEIWNKLI